MKKNTIVLGLLLAVAALFAQTEADFTVGLTEDGEGVVITGYTGTATAVKIPATIQGMPVREIGRNSASGREMGAFHNKSITSVVIPEGVTVIRKSGFEQDYPGSDKLVQITLPSTLRIIEDTAFSDNRGLKSIVIPEGVTEIGDGAFYDCSSLASVTLPQSLETIGKRAFLRAGITAITLPPKLTRIAGEMFQRCTKLTSVTLSVAIQSIDDRAFDGCSALTSVTLPSTIHKIGNRAFDGCSALTTVTIPDTVAKIEFRNTSFRGCSKVNLASQARIKKVGYEGGF